MNYFHLLHLLVEFSFTFSGVLCSLTVIYLALCRTTNKTVRVYAYMLVMNSGVDLTYSLGNLFHMPIVYIYDGILFVVVGNPFVPRSTFIGHVNIALQGCVTFVSVAMLAVQFYYRYNVVRNHPMTPLGLLKAFGVACILPLLHGGLAFYDFDNPSERYDRILATNPFINDPNDMPNYVACDSQVFSKLVVYHFSLNAQVTILSYITIVVVYYKTRKHLAAFNHQITESTRKAQQRMTKIIFIQAMFPFVLLFIPGTILPIAAYFNWHNHYVGEYIGLFLHSTPVFNSFSVVLCIPSYRRIVRGWFCFWSVATDVSPHTSDSPADGATAKPSFRARLFGRRPFNIVHGAVNQNSSQLQATGSST